MTVLELELLDFESAPPCESFTAPCDNTAEWVGVYEYYCPHVRVLCTPCRDEQDTFQTEGLKTPGAYLACGDCGQRTGKFLRWEHL